MTEHPPPSTHAFRSLQRALVRRRLAAVEPILRLELGALLILVAMFLFWQARIPFDSQSRAHGPGSVAAAVLVIWVVLALVGGSLAGARHLFQLRRGVPGPPWLALPIPPAPLERHLAWEARGHALWVVPTAPAILAATVGLIPGAWTLPLAAAFVWMLLGSSRLGCALARRLAVGAAEPRPGILPLTRVLATAARPLRCGPRQEARWRRASPWQALWRKDLLLCRRPTAARRRLWVPIVIAVLSVSSWALPVPPAFARLLAFALALTAAATFGEWLIALSGEDPFTVARGLPASIPAIWWARAVWGVLISAALVAAHTLAARPLQPPALQLFLVWTGAAALLIMLLAVHYSITLFPRHHLAQRLYALSLGLALVVSWILPLMGWVALSAAILHSALRIPRWSRLEESS